MRSSDIERLNRLTNVRELVPAPPAAQPDPSLDPAGESGGSAPDPYAPAARSTHDPLTTQLAVATVAEAIADRPMKPGVRWFAWIFLAWPPLILWFLLAMEVFSDDGASSLGQETPWFEVFLLAVGLVPALYWPYLLLGSSSGKR